MSAEPVEVEGTGVTPDMLRGPGGSWWRIVARDERGFPTEMREMRDVAMVTNERGDVLGFSVGVHPSRGLMDPADVIYRPDALAEPQPRPQSHACAALASLDCYAASGDHTAALLARFHAEHPNGPETPEQYAEEAAIRAGFVKRRSHP